MRRLLAAAATLALVMVGGSAAIAEEPVVAMSEKWTTLPGEAPVAYIQTDYHTLIFACASTQAISCSSIRCGPAR